MPIKFRCDYCRQLLGIAHTKAGSLVDCPTCGRTLRVPNEDGTVDPPPAVGLNLADDGLRRALDELAELDQAKPKPGAELNAQPASATDDSLGGRQSTRGLLETPPVVVKPKPIVQVPKPSLPQSNAIALEPLPAAAVITAPEPQRGNSAGPSHEPPAAALAGASPEEILAGIPGPAPAVKAATSRPTPAAPNQGYAFRWLVAVGVASGFIGVGLGFGLGRIFLSSGVIESRSPAVREVVPEAAPAKPQVKGRITFRNARGQVEPDAGACLILVPSPRDNAVKLPSVGLRPNDESKVRLQALDVLQGQGGRLAIADSDGNYHFELPEERTYQVILLSHFQGRLADDPGPEEARKAVEENFDRPEQLVGKLAFEMAEFAYAGTRTIVWDYTFSPSKSE